MLIPKNEKLKIIAEFTKLCILRGESFEDYNGEEVNGQYPDYFNVWIDEFARQGFTSEQVLEMIQAAKKLPKYGTIKLAIGDLITNWEKAHEANNNVSWTDFIKCLNLYLKRDMKLLDKLAQEFLGINWIKIEDKNKFYNYMLWITAQIEHETNVVEHANRIETNTAVINVFEQIKQDVKLAEKADRYIKSELIKYLRSLAEYFEDECTEYINVLINKKPVKNTDGSFLTEPRYNVSKFFIHLSHKIREINNE